MRKPRYPNVNVKLTDEDGNSFVIIGRVRKALKKAGIPNEEVENFTEEATADDYDHLLRTVMTWVSTY